MKVKIDDKSVTFAGCPNCENDLSPETAYEFDSGTIEMEFLKTIPVIYVICRNCGYVMTFVDRQKHQL